MRPFKLIAPGHSSRPRAPARGRLLTQDVSVRAFFDPMPYLDRYPDVAESGIDPWEHFDRHGRAEGRRASLLFFDETFYRMRHCHDDDAQADPLSHYLAHGRESGFDPNPFFDNGWYVARQAVTALSGLEHYILHGEAAGASPHPLWDEERYLSINIDVQQLKRLRKIRSGYYHFVRTGAAELESGRYRHFQFRWGPRVLAYDPNAYLADNPDVTISVRKGIFRSGLEHLFSVGFRQALDGLRALYSPRHEVRLLKHVEVAAQNPGKYLCLFAHYDPDGLVATYIIDYLASLRRMNVDIVFITATSTESELSKLGRFVHRIIVKNEAGRDFGSWCLALEVLGLDCGKHYDRVIFANDSIYFPVQPIEPMFADMELKRYNLYGLSDSRDLWSYHVQSFFLAFDKVAQKAIFPVFVEKFRQNYVLTKWGQIREYELGLTRIAKTAGLSVGAYVSIDELRDDILRSPELQKWQELVRSGVEHLNPTLDLWDLIIRRYGYTGLKVQLLRDNPKGATNLNLVPQLVAEGGVPVEHMEEHISRLTSQLTTPSRRMPVAYPLELVVRERLVGNGRTDAERLVLFAHYDPDGLIDPYVLTQMAGLAAAECAVVFVTSTCERRELEKLTPFVRAILVKNDAGRDFGSWYLAIKEFSTHFNDYKSIIWMNDSTYFPLFDPNIMFSKMDANNYDFWGVVDSYSVNWHIGSWFWAFGRASIHAGWFDWFLKEYNPSYTKWAQIHNFEMRLPAMIKSSGLKVGTYIDARQVEAHVELNHPQHGRMESARRGDSSVTHDFWMESITEFGCPALKVELLRDNPLDIELSQVFETVKRRTNYDPNLIRGHLLRLKAKHLPPPARGEFGLPE